MQLNSALACVKIPTGLNFGPVALARLETWITAPEMGGDEWGHVKSCLFVRLTTKDGLYGWGEAFVLPYSEKAVAEIIHALGRSASTLKSISPCKKLKNSDCLSLIKVIATASSFGNLSPFSFSK